MQLIVFKLWPSISSCVPYALCEENGRIAENRY